MGSEDEAVVAMRRAFRELYELDPEAFESVLMDLIRAGDRWKDHLPPINIGRALSLFRWINRPLCFCWPTIETLAPAGSRESTSWRNPQKAVLDTGTVTSSESGTQPRPSPAI